MYYEGNNSGDQIERIPLPDIQHDIRQANCCNPINDNTTETTLCTTTENKTDNSLESGFVIKLLSNKKFNNIFNSFLLTIIAINFNINLASFKIHHNNDCALKDFNVCLKY